MANNMAHIFPYTLFMWCLVIALGHIMVGFMISELSVIWDIDPGIYDQDNINGIGDHDRHDYNVFAAQITFVVGALSGLISGSLVHYGRRKVLIIADIVMIISSGVLMIRSYPILLLGRALRGISYGMFIHGVPLFISEIAPHKYRAQWISLLEIGQTTGVMIGYLIGLIFPPFTIPYPETELPYGYSVRNKTLNWRIFFLFPIIPALIQCLFLLFKFKEDSPRYYSDTSFIDRPIENFSTMKYESPNESIQNDDCNDSVHSNDSLRSLFRGKMMKATILGTLILGLRQFSGINVVEQYVFYFRVSGNNKDYLQFMIAGMRIIAAILAYFVVAKVGRKSLLLFGFMGSGAINSLLFLVFDDDSISNLNNTYSIALTITEILIITIYIMGFYITISSTTWIYVTDIMNAKALGVATFFGLLSRSITTSLPWIAIHFNDKYDQEIAFNKYVAIFFFLFGGGSIAGFFVILVFVEETQSMSEDNLKKIYQKL